jgi:hypothetical protein
LCVGCFCNHEHDSAHFQSFGTFEIVGFRAVSLRFLRSKQFAPKSTISKRPDFLGRAQQVTAGPSKSLPGKNNFENTT